MRFFSESERGGQTFQANVNKDVMFDALAGWFTWSHKLFRHLGLVTTKNWVEAGRRCAPKTSYE